MSATCPAGHVSEAADFCDHCGLLITTDGPALDAPVDEVPAEVESLTPAVASTPVPEATRACPVCHEAAQSGRFCEGCGFDLEQGTPPASEDPGSGEPGSAGPTIGDWEAVVEIGADDHRDADVDIEAPPEIVRRRVPLPEGRVRIGRRRASSDDGPEIDLALAPTDTGVSHEHAELLLVDGHWTVVDLGSTNGTFLNDVREPIEPNCPAELHDGDRILIGAWTTITLERIARELTEPEA